MGQMEQQDQTFPHTSQRCYSAEYSQTLNMRPLKATTTLRRQTQKFHDFPVTRNMPGAHTRQREQGLWSSCSQDPLNMTQQWPGRGGGEGTRGEASQPLALLRM